MKYRSSIWRHLIIAFSLMVLASTVVVESASATEPELLKGNEEALPSGAEVRMTSEEGTEPSFDVYLQGEPGIEKAIYCKSISSSGGKMTSASAFQIKLIFTGCKTHIIGEAECSSGSTPGVVETHTLLFKIKLEPYFEGEVSLFGENAEEEEVRQIADMVCVEPWRREELELRGCFLVAWNSPINTSTTMIQGIWFDATGQSCNDGFVNDITTMLSVKVSGTIIPIMIKRY